MEIVITVVIIVAALAALVWIGLKVKPAPYPPFGGQTQEAGTVPLPADLPAPVERSFRQTYGAQAPVVASAVLAGRGTMAPFGVRLPMRFRFLYDQDRDYRAYFDVTFFGVPFMKADETYIDGVGVGRLPGGVDQGPWFDESMNVRVWAEILTWFPAPLVTDPRVRWQALDEDSALLGVPFGEGGRQWLVVRFDPDTGKVKYFEAYKHKNAREKDLWINAIWFSQGRPWIHLDIEEKLFNVATREAIRAASRP